MTKRYRQVACGLCGQVFAPTGARQMYCPGCRDDAEKIQRRRREMTTADGRLQVRIDDTLAGWLKDRAQRMHADSSNIQARSELGLWYSALGSELRRIRLTLAQASCIADVCNGWLMDATLAAGFGLVYAECYDAFKIARDVPAGLNPDISSYGVKWGPEDGNAEEWEGNLLAYLHGLNPVADHALRDAISRWWEQGLDATVEGFAKVGLRVSRETAGGETAASEQEK